MDGNNQNKTKNVQYSQKMKKKKNSKKEIPIELSDDQRQINELCSKQITSEAKVISNDVKNKFEKVEPKQSKNNPEEKLKNDAVVTNQKKNNGKNLESSKNFNAREKPHQKKMKPKKSFNRKVDKETLLQSEKNDLLDELNGETFEFEDVLNNARVLELIQDLVSCFTSNSTLPENELQTLKISLFERTCHVFLSILNSCVKKAFTRVLNSDFLQEFKKRCASKKDACCQTLFSDISDGEGSQLQKNAFP